MCVYINNRKGNSYWRSHSSPELAPKPPREYCVSLAGAPAAAAAGRGVSRMSPITYCRPTPVAVGRSGCRPRSRSCCCGRCRRWPSVCRGSSTARRRPPWPSSGRPLPTPTYHRHQLHHFDACDSTAQPLLLCGPAIK